MQIGRLQAVIGSHAEAGKVHDYLKEQWAMQRAREVGVPTPTVLEVAQADPGATILIQRGHPTD